MITNQQFNAWFLKFDFRDEITSDDLLNYIRKQSNLLMQRIVRVIDNILRSNCQLIPVSASSHAEVKLDWSILNEMIDEQMRLKLNSIPQLKACNQGNPY